ncbi:MAG: transaldolase family protein [Sphaerochaetaceae bacterium]|nr:transaldolase family protein [Sphaerochaetaceae bacterium]
MYNTGYFQRVKKTTATRFWINNPTIEDAVKAIEAGAVGCTTNPSYVSKLLKSPSDRAYVTRTIRLLSPYIEDNSELAAMVQRIMVSRLSDLFMPMYESSEGRYGFVTIQSNPYHEEDASAIIADGIENRKIGDNIMVKIPVTAYGIEAIRTLAGKGTPTMATEVMSLSQAISIAEAYRETTQELKEQPPFFLTHITGILDDHFKRVIRNENIQISDEAVRAAGLSIAKKQYKLLKERNYPGTMIGGGARKLEDFTELVGGDLHITINWKGTAETLIEQDMDVVSRIDDIPEDSIIAELKEKLSDYRRAYAEDGMKESEYYDFGGVELFRSSFVKGWDVLVEYIKKVRRQ